MWRRDGLMAYTKSIVNWHVTPALKTKCSWSYVDCCLQGKTLLAVTPVGNELWPNQVDIRQSSPFGPLPLLLSGVQLLELFLDINPLKIFTDLTLDWLFLWSRWPGLARVIAAEAWLATTYKLALPSTAGAIQFFGVGSCELQIKFDVQQWLPGGDLILYSKILELAFT